MAFVSAARIRLLAGVLAAAFVLPSALAAQNAPADPVAAATELLRLTDVETHGERDGRVRDIRASLPGGARVDIEFDRSGAVEEVEARGPDRFPIAEVEPLVPAAVRSNANFPTGAVLDKIEINDDGSIELEGFLADGRPFEAEFTAAGEMIGLEIDD